MGASVDRLLRCAFRCSRVPVVLLGLLTGGCTTSTVEQLQLHPAARVAPDEWVVVLGRRQNFRNPTEEEFTRCVHETLLRRKQLPVKPEEQFMDEMFPWFQPRTAPRSADDLAERLRDRAIAERLRDTGTRYVIWLEGFTRRTDDGGNMSCSVGPGGGFCFGMLWWENDAAYEASIWDVAELRTMGKIAVDASGTSWLPAVIVPVPLVAPTRAAACRNIVRQIEEFLQYEPGDLQYEREDDVSTLSR